MDEKENKISLLVVRIIFLCSLCIYFIYHMINGKYSLYSLKNSKKILEETQNSYNKQLYNNNKKNNKISRLKKGNLDLDLLEEEMKKNIGIVNQNEIVILEKDLNKK